MQAKAEVVDELGAGRCPVLGRVRCLRHVGRPFAKVARPRLSSLVPGTRATAKSVHVSTLSTRHHPQAIDDHTIGDRRSRDRPSGAEQPLRPLGPVLDCADQGRPDRTRSGGKVADIRGRGRPVLQPARIPSYSRTARQCGARPTQPRAFLARHRRRDCPRPSKRSSDRPSRTRRCSAVVSDQVRTTVPFAPAWDLKAFASGEMGEILSRRRLRGFAARRFPSRSSRR